jgi:hypothetical protein
MSCVAFDKENASELMYKHVTSSAVSTRKFGDSVRKSAQVLLSTPQHKMKHKDTKSITNTEGKRRALGDLMNTHQALATPKASLNSKFGTPMRSHCMKKLATDFENQSIGSCKIKSETPSAETLSEYPPAEQCIQQVDTFNDLFEDGKLSDLFTKRKVTYVPRLPVASPKYADNNMMHVFDTNAKKVVKEMNKLIKKETKKENEAFLENYQEMPDILDLEPILEDLSFGSDLDFSM